MSFLLSNMNWFLVQRSSGVARNFRGGDIGAKAIQRTWHNGSICSFLLKGKVRKGGDMAQCPPLSTLTQRRLWLEGKNGQLLGFASVECDKCVNVVFRFTRKQRIDAVPYFQSECIGCRASAISTSRACNTGSWWQYVFFFQMFKFGKNFSTALLTEWPNTSQLVLEIRGSGRSNRTQLPSPHVKFMWALSPH